MDKSNIGGRRQRMAKEHLFVLYGMISEIVNNKNADPIDVVVYDVEKAYDKLWLDDSLNDLVDTLSEEKSNNNVTLLKKLNETTSVSIKTPFGQTERETFNNIVQQGGSWGGILCANSVGSVETKSGEIKSSTKLD